MPAERKRCSSETDAPGGGVCHRGKEILVVEDEASIASFVALYLKNAGYSVRTATTGSEALTQVATEAPALIVLDLMLPDIDGIEVCRRIRQRSDVPILMLTARDEDVDKIIGLEVGADDYLTKPFNPRELVARVKSILRRTTPDRGQARAPSSARRPLVDAGRREVRVGDQEIQLAPKEFDLLWELLDHRGLVLTRDQLLERVWGYTFAGDTRTVDVHVRQIRRKLGDASPIVTVWGVGYKVAPERSAVSEAASYSPCGRSASACRRSSSPGSCSRDSSPRSRRWRCSRTTRGTGTFAELRREVTALRGSTREAAVRRGAAGSRRKLEQATGDRLYYAGVDIFPGAPDLASCPRGLRLAGASRVEHVASSSRRPTRPALPGRRAADRLDPDETFGALVVATPRASSASAGWRWSSGSASRSSAACSSRAPRLVPVAADHGAGRWRSRARGRDRGGPLRRGGPAASGRTTRSAHLAERFGRWPRGSRRPTSWSGTSS